MTEKEQKIIEVFKNIFPKLDEAEKEKLLCFGEGIAFFKKTEDARRRAKEGA